MTIYEVLQESFNWALQCLEYFMNEFLSSKLLIKAAFLLCLPSMVGDDDEDAVSDSESNEPLKADVLSKK